MDNMVAAQGDKREKLDALKREVAVAEDVLQRQKDALTDRVTKARAVLAQKNREAKKRVAVAQRKLLEKEFARKRRMARSVKETEAFLEAQREKVVRAKGRWRPARKPSLAAARPSSSWSEKRGRTTSTCQKTRPPRRRFRTATCPWPSCRP